MAERKNAASWSDSSKSLYRSTRLRLKVELLVLLSVYFCMMTAPCLAEPFHCPPSIQCCKCKPSELEVNCNNCRLTQVPDDLPYTTQRLLLNMNKIRNLKDYSFKCVPNLTHLELNVNKIRYIGSGTFRYLQQLSFLDMSQNSIWPNITEANVFCGLPRKINTLKFRYMYNWKIMTKKLFHCLQNSSLELLDLSGNPAALNVTNGTFANLKQLKNLIIRNTPSKYFNVFAYENDTKLTMLDLRKNQIDTFPTFAKPINGSFQAVLPGLKYLDLRGNKISELNKNLLHGLENIISLKLTNNNIKYLGPASIQPLTSLQILLLGGNQIYSIDSEALNSSTLLHVNLRHNKKLRILNKQRDVFKNCPNIQTVAINDVSFSYETMELMFQNITTLRTLSLAQTNKFRQIPSNTFRGLHNLTTLQLQDNSLRHVDWNVFRDLKSLKSLYLHSNHIRNINETSLPSHLWSSLEKLQVWNNPLHCDCELFWFIAWALSNKNKVTSLNATYCGSPYRKTILKAGISLDTCIQKLLSTRIKIAWGISTFMVLFTVLYSAVVRYQWHVRTWVFRLSLYMNSDRNLTASQQETEYTFDAFVCYNSDDSDWVRNVLLPELEENSEPPFRICEYHRNWPSGSSMLNCIQQSIQCSRKVLLIVTNAFMQSEWCQFELISVQENLLHQDKDNVILAIMEDIEPQNMTPILFLEMKRKTYLEWTDEAVGRRLFFHKLRQSLLKPNYSLFRAMPKPQLINTLQ